MGREWGGDTAVTGVVRWPWARLSLVAANLMPLAGVLFWGWDAFLLLILYWMETVVIAFWTLVRMARPDEPDLPGRASVLGVARRIAWPVFRALLLSVNVSVFIAAHLAFLWVLFSGPWGERTGGLEPFLRHALFREGLWLPLLIMFLARGAFFFVPILTRLLPRLCRIVGLDADQESEPRAETLLAGLYARIAVMQITIIIGGWFAMLIGSFAPLVLLILFKTVADWKLQPTERVTVRPDAGRYRFRSPPVSQK